MEEVSILKRSLILMGKLVGLSAIFVALLSVALVVLTGRAVLALSGGSSRDQRDEQVSARPGDKSSSPRTAATNSPPIATKPNG
jgi:hypothetical protein